MNAVAGSLYLIVRFDGHFRKLLENHLLGSIRLFKADKKGSEKAEKHLGQAEKSVETGCLDQ